MTWLQVLMYAAVAIFVIGTAYKAITISRMPLHLRWDLYPIPSEKGREEYGGSYFEEVNWWTKPKNVSFIGEVKEMLKEMLFIQSMYQNNRSLWFSSFPFHFGLYLSFVFVLLIILGAVIQLAGGTVAADAGGGFARFIYVITIVFGVAGAILAAAGALGLLLNRIFRADLRRSAVPTDYFNLMLLIALFVTGLIAWSNSGLIFTNMRAAMASLVTFGSLETLPGMLTVHLTLVAVFLLWLPMTHMTHFVGKYFTYHKVRWEDHPNLRGSKVEQQVTKALGYKITWSASHIKSGGTWAEAASDNEPSAKKEG
jgi:nitrate reductase gamma subunit